MEEQKFKVIIVEDVKLELKGTEEIFRHEIPNAEVIGTAMTESEFWPLMEAQLPDLVLLDLGLGGSTTIGVDICRNIFKRYKGVRVLIFTGEAFLFPSEGEGFGLPVVEAMQFGKAVFAANRTSLPEVCNGHAIMWEHLDTESMVQSIREHLPDFYKDEERLTRMKEHAASFSYEKHIQAYLDLYRELAQLS